MGWFLKLDLENKAHKETLVKYPDRGIPRIEINLNEISLEEVKNGPKETKYEDNELIVYDGREIESYNGVEIKGRGNTTWVQGKKPYQIKFKNKVNLFELGEAKKWVLLANYYDASLIRNDIAMLIAEMLEMEYNARGEFVELYFNGEYEGLYYLLKKIEISKGSVDLREKDGVLFEIDTLHKYEEECYTSYLGDCLVLKDIVDNEEENEQLAVENFLEDFNKLEIAVEKGNYEEVVKLIDVDSFVKYFLVNEFTVNPDAYASSFYLYRDGADDKINAGPVWDFDLALGNRAWVWGVDENFFSPNISMVRKREVFGQDGLEEDLNTSKLFYYLMEIPEFKDEVKRVFQEKMSGRGDEFKIRIRQRLNEIDEAAKFNDEKWEVEGFRSEVIELMEWVTERYEFFEKTYGEKELEREDNLIL